jgi:hypothetical protein
MAHLVPDFNFPESRVLIIITGSLLIDCLRFTSALSLYAADEDASQVARYA